MKFLHFALLAAVPLGLNAGVAMAAPATAAARLNTTIPLETLVANPAAKAIVDRELPGLTSHGMFDTFKRFSLDDLKPMAGGEITDAKLAAINTALAKLPAK
ncbi:hypothetical protein SAMN06295912_1347 [Sphingomonas laterariae]|uniref:Helix-hairpin-helix motif-containing protein n=1 Tax=Edaphosphingomonas laterariae TaxID=861865 RepID=A0A239JF53_9SPHN|nr:hypothetical protein [Sphingomonas laterariae]SNT04450.1 hypothetical protein SAMN06295912_1347 [Sphingomonas laterariae]